MVELEFSYEFFHRPLLLVHVILKYLDLSFEADVFLAISVNLDLKLDGILVQLLLFFNVVAIGCLNLDLYSV